MPLPAPIPNRRPFSFAARIKPVRRLIAGGLCCVWLSGCAGAPKVAEMPTPQETRVVEKQKTPLPSEETLSLVSMIGRDSGTPATSKGTSQPVVRPTVPRTQPVAEKRERRLLGIFGSDEKKSEPELKEDPFLALENQQGNEGQQRNSAVEAKRVRTADASPVATPSEPVAERREPLPENTPNQFVAGFDSQLQNLMRDASPPELPTESVADPKAQPSGSPFETANTSPTAAPEFPAELGEDSPPTPVAKSEPQPTLNPFEFVEEVAPVEVTEPVVQSEPVVPVDSGEFPWASKPEPAAQPVVSRTSEPAPVAHPLEERSFAPVGTGPELASRPRTVRRTNSLPPAIVDRYAPTRRLPLTAPDRTFGFDPETTVDASAEPNPGPMQTAEVIATDFPSDMEAGDASSWVQPHPLLGTDVEAESQPAPEVADPGPVVEAVRVATPAAAPTWNSDAVDLSMIVPSDQVPSKFDSAEFIDLPTVSRDVPVVAPELEITPRRQPALNGPTLVPIRGISFRQAPASKPGEGVLAIETVANANPPRKLGPVPSRRLITDARDQRVLPSDPLAAVESARSSLLSATKTDVPMELAVQPIEFSSPMLTGPVETSGSVEETPLVEDAAIATKQTPPWLQTASVAITLLILGITAWWHQRRMGAAENARKP